jgi:hypothetical protein
MATQTPNSPKIGVARTKPLRPLRLPVFFGSMAAAVVTIVVLLLVFPNLPGHLGFLALAVLTTLFSFGSIGLTFSGLRPRMPVAARWLVSIVLWTFVALDVIFLMLPLFISGPAANDADPFASGAKPAAQATATSTPPKTTEAVTTQTTEAAMVKTTVAIAQATTVAVTTPAQTSASAPAPATSAAQTTAASLLAGDFNNQGAEPVAGRAILGKSADGKIVLRLENLKSAPGPDLFVYLAKNASPDASQVQKGLEVGKLKATSGNLNYELGSSLDLSQYKSVVVYCKSFSAVFGFANLK